MATQQKSWPDLGLSILGLASQYPPHSLTPSALETLSKRFYPESPSMTKVLSINRFTGIETRSSVGTPDHPVVNEENAPSIAQLHELFLSDGVPLAVSASRKAMSEARTPASQITHVVSTTCTDSANPGYDHYLAKQLGLSSSVEKVLLHGVGCSGGLAALRTAANMALGHTMRGRPARILVNALEVSTTMVRSELDSVAELQETRIGVALFSDCASALVLSNGIGEAAEPVYELLGWEHKIIPDTEGDLGFDVHPNGWKVVLSPRVPRLAADILQPTYTSFLSSFPGLSSSTSSSSSSSSSTPSSSPPPPPLSSSLPAPSDFDWAMHPGGALILTGAEKALSLTPEHMRASYDVYMKHGNSSSATIFSVLDRLRCKDMDALAPGANASTSAINRLHEHVIGCAFGPGIAVEMCMLRRNLGLRNGATGLQTPPETESESSRSEAGGEEVEQRLPDERVKDAVESGVREMAATQGLRGGSSRDDDKKEKEALGNDSFISEALEGVELD